MKHQLLQTIMFLGVMSTGVFGMQDNTAISCQVSDPGQFLPQNFSESLCAKLASDLNIKSVSADPETTDSQKNALHLTLEAISEHRAQYSLTVRNSASSSQNGVDTFGPFIVETMDATLETALPDHLKNDLKRLLEL